MLRGGSEDRQSTCGFYCAVKPYIIFNPRAGSVINREKVLSQLTQLSPLALRITRKAGDAEKWARSAVRTKCDYIVVAGGDGNIKRSGEWVSRRRKERSHRNRTAWNGE
jgi:diacylglycerol kinase family enzyme